MMATEDPAISHGVADTVTTEAKSEVEPATEEVHATNSNGYLQGEKELTPSKSSLKRCIPRWFSGKVSPVFDKHIFWPSPEKKRKNV